jgi:hypothetical protein
MSIRRLASAGIVCATLALIATTTPAADAATSYAAQRKSAADWQGDQLVAGQIPSSFGGTDWGLTVDTMLQMAADGTQPIRQARTKLAIERHILDYTTFSGTVYAGSSSKALVAVEVMGDDPGNVNGVNLRQQVLDLIEHSGPSHGRVSDSAGPDYSNTFAQAYAVIGLARAHQLNAHPFVLQYLLKQQCQGGFRLAEASTQCTSAAADVDATALAIQAINAARGVGGVPVAVDRFDRAVAWLMSRQHATRSFSEPLRLPRNANSTGLAAQAQASAHRFTSLHKAQAWMVTIQLTAANAHHAKDIGAIAFDRDAFRTAVEDGITSTTLDQFRRATPQGSFAFAPIPLARLTLS